jgi:hypothetical protein
VKAPRSKRIGCVYAGGYERLAGVDASLHLVEDHQPPKSNFRLRLYGGDDPQVRFKEAQDFLTSSAQCLSNPLCLLHHLFGGLHGFRKAPVVEVLDEQQPQDSLNRCGMPFPISRVGKVPGWPGRDLLKEDSTAANTALTNVYASLKVNPLVTSQRWQLPDFSRLLRWSYDWIGGYPKRLSRPINT